MTDLAVAHAIVSRSEWKHRPCRQRWGWLQLVASGTVWSFNLVDPKVQTSKRCCLHPPNNLIFRNPRRPGTLHGSFLSSIPHLPKACLSVTFLLATVVAAGLWWRQSKHGRCPRTATTWWEIQCLACADAALHIFGVILQWNHSTLSIVCWWPCVVAVYFPQPARNFFFCSSNSLLFYTLNFSSIQISW